MRFISEIPATPEIGNCDKHGDYEFKYTQLNTDKVFVKRNCSGCAREQGEREEEAEKAQRIESAKKVIELIRSRAGISKRNMHKTFDDYICKNPDQQKAKNSCIKFVESFPCENSLLMLGSVGTGKTLLASAMIDKLCDKHKCKIEKVSKIMQNLKNTYRKDSENSEDQVSEFYIGLDLLIIDEVGTQFGSDFEKLFMFEIIDGRYQDMKPTILISNLDVDGVKNVIGERCLDRLRDGGGSMVAFNWQSERG